MQEKVSSCGTLRPIRYMDSKVQANLDLSFDSKYSCLKKYNYHK